ncbi:MAG: 7-carboxy-7-deazaguanine synthase QueE [Pirellulales bacterium]
MRIAELYQSVQGEGLLTGAPSVFVRASGCNLRCSFCDTPYTSWAPEGDDWSVAEIVSRTLELGVQHVVITGGEPMLFAELVPLCDELRAAGRHITIETAGTLFLDLACDLMSISPKRANSTPPVDRAGSWTARHERTRHQPAVIRRLVARYAYQFKFVIDRHEDLADLDDYLREFPEIDRDRVLLMPQGTDLATLQATARWLEPYCAEHALRYCPRKHVEWYGFQRGT